MTEGYRWYVNFADGEYEPCEETFHTLETCQNSIDSYADTYSSQCIGIDYVSDDDGFITILERIKLPNSIHFLKY